MTHADSDSHHFDGGAMTLRASAGLNRRTFLSATAGLAAGGLLGGCASTTTASGATRVTIWSWLTGMDKYVAAFNAAHPDISVELNVIAAGLKGGYADRKSKRLKSSHRT